MKMKQTIMSIRRYLFLRGTGSRSKTKKKTVQKDPRQKKKNEKEEDRGVSRAILWVYGT